MAVSRSEQLNVLCERYLEIMLADRGNTFLLLVQAPIIAFLIVLNWRDVDAVTDSLFYTLALSALWFGTFNSFREVVKERPILEREARLGVSVLPYLFSKCAVLSLVSFIQCLLLAYIVNRSLPLGGPVLVHFFYLWLCSIGGIGMGLLLSCLMSNSDRAVGGMVLVLIPQMLFSGMVLSHDNASNLVLWCEDMTFISWCFHGLKEVTASEWKWINLLQCASMLMVLGLACVSCSYLLLRWRLRKVKG